MKNLTTKQIRFRQHANKIKKAWQSNPETIQLSIQKILDGYADKQLEQQLLMVYFELVFAIYKKPIRAEDPDKYDLILSWVRKRKAEVISEIFFQAFIFQWKNKYWVTKIAEVNAIKEAQKILTRNLLEGTSGDEQKIEKVKISQLLSNGVFPDVTKFNPVDIAEVISGMKSLDYFEQELINLEIPNNDKGYPLSNLIIQVKPESEEGDLNGLDKFISINIPIKPITRAIDNLSPTGPPHDKSQDEQAAPIELYNRKNAAKVLQVSPPTLDSFVKNGSLVYVTLGKDGEKRYRREDLEACILERNKNVRR
jgi:hypothetical protein